MIAVLYRLRDDELLDQMGSSRGTAATRSMLRSYDAMTAIPVRSALSRRLVERLQDVADLGEDVGDSQEGRGGRPGL